MFNLIKVIQRLKVTRLFPLSDFDPFSDGMKWLQRTHGIRIFENSPTIQHTHKLKQCAIAQYRAAVSKKEDETKGLWNYCLKKKKMKKLQSSVISPVDEIIKLQLLLLVVDGGHLLLLCTRQEKG